MITKEQLEQRLARLDTELEAGRRRLAALDAERAQTQQTLLRITGAAQVLRELLEEARDCDESRVRMAAVN